MAVLFVLVLLAVAKNGDGMRASSQAASMLETEVTLGGKNGCAKFGAKKKSRRQPNICYCPKELSFPRNCEGTSGRSFNLKETIKEGSDCRCRGRDPCEKFGAKSHDEDWEGQSDLHQLCECPSDRPFTTEECHGDVSSRGWTFRLSRARASSRCRCVTAAEGLERFKMPVAASALRPWWSRASKTRAICHPS